MDFKANKPIYQQIVDFCFAKILIAEWIKDQRIPSVRELAVILAVNPHTALKAYEYLQGEEIIYTKRGLGFFLSEGAIEKVTKLQKEEFFQSTLEETFNIMDLLNIDIKEIVVLYQKRKGNLR
jgi:DNA-binding transcriptional regulator YhcF (GntR family)